MFKIFVSFILSLAVCVNTAWAPLAQAEIPKGPPTPTVVVSTAKSADCRATLTDETAPQAMAKSFPKTAVTALLTYVVPYYPFKKLWDNPDKRFNVLIEKPLLGIISSTVGVTIARALSTNKSTWFGNFVDSYVSYTLKDVVGNTVSLNDDLSEKQKYWINYLITVGFYSFVTMQTAHVTDKITAVLSHLANSTANDISGAAYAISLVAFSFIWPLLSQKVNTNILPPLLLNRYIQKQEMPLADVEKNPDSQAIYRSYEARITKLTAENTPKSLKDARYTRFRYMWIKWRREGLKPNDLNPYTGSVVKKAYKPLSVFWYWALKSSVMTLFASAMIVGYFFARNHFVGTSPDDLSLLSKSIVVFLDHLREADLDSAAQTILSQIPPGVLESKP